MTPCYYVKCYLREQFLILSTNSVSPVLAFLFQRIGATYQYSPLEVKKPNRTTIVVVTAAIRGPSIFSLYVIRSLHNKNVQIKKKATPNKFTVPTLYFLLYYFTTPKRWLVAVTVFGLFTLPQVVAGHNLHCYNLPLAPGASATRKARATREVEEKGHRISRGWVEGGYFPFSSDPPHLSYTLTIDASRTRHRNRPNSLSFFSDDIFLLPAAQPPLLPPCRH